MGKVKLWVIVVVVGLLGGRARPVDANSLAGQLHSYISKNQPVRGGVFVDTLTPVIVQLASQATDFPVPPTTPGYVFVYNAQQGIFERYTGSLGPVFLERAETLGANHAAFGVSYLYGNVDSFDGSNVADGRPRFADVFKDISIGSTTFRKVTTGFQMNSFSLPTHRFNLAGTYGITDNWDFGLLLPLVFTRLKTSGIGFLTTQGPNQTVSEPATSFDESSFGVGDLLVRTKYRFGYLADFDFAGSLVLRCPTGNAEDFHGLGDWTVQPLLVISRAIGLNDFHANLGMEFNASDSRRTRAIYGIGTTLQTEAIDWPVALLLDIIGSSGLDNQQVTTSLGSGHSVVPDSFEFPTFGSTTIVPTATGANVVTTLPRTDQVNVAVGFKFAIYGNALGYMNAVVPLTRQGLQADVISAAGVEYSF
jgi:hypothetical protein